MKLNIQLKLISHPRVSPMRFGLIQDGHLLFTISLSTKKDRLAKSFVNQEVSAKIELDENELTDLQVAEKKYLTIEMMNFLASKEVSVYKLNNWLDKRQIAPDLKEELIRLAKQENFLSHERYIENHVNKNFAKGKKPWFQLRRELEQELQSQKASLEEQEQIRILLDQYSYRDIDLLLKNTSLCKELTKIMALEDDGNNMEQYQKLFVKFKNRLLMRGFHPSIIQELVNCFRSE